MLSVREKQLVALKRMLNFNAPLTSSCAAEPQWKILVYDRFGQDILSPLLTVNQLRDLGVTLHLNLHTDRDAIPDVPAIYFVLPSEENVKRICRDLKNCVYESFYFNFISAISRQKLENIATSAIQSDTVHRVAKVVDQYLSFISLEDNLFCLRHQDRLPISYYTINRCNTKDEEISNSISIIVDGLFSVFVTLGVIPIIRCPKGNSAEMVSKRLDKKLRENLRDTQNNLFLTESPAGQFGFQRPLLIILDRNIDLASMLHHSWTYQALMHDVLEFCLNRVEVDEAVTVSEHSNICKPCPRKKIYDMYSNDQFWVAQRGSPFPIVAEAVQEALDSYRSEEEEVKKLKAAMGLEGEDDVAINMLSDTTAKLTSAVSSLPVLLEKKRLIDMHTTIATALLEHIKHRKLDNYFELEEKMMSKAKFSKSIMDTISDPEAGRPEDKVRFFIIALICGPAMPEDEVEQYCDALEASNCQLDAVRYVRSWKRYHKILTSSSMYAGGEVSSTSMFSSLLSKGSSFFMEGVKNLVVRQHNLPVTRVLDALIDDKPSSLEAEDFLYFDPKLLRCNGSSTPRNRSVSQDAFVFVIGGGNYIEYQNLVDYAKSKPATWQKRIMYGCSDMVSPSAFLRQLAELGREL